MDNISIESFVAGKGKSKKRFYLVYQRIPYVASRGLFDLFKPTIQYKEVKLLETTQYSEVSNYLKNIYDKEVTYDNI